MIGEASIESLNDHQLLVISVSGMHAHLLVELPGRVWEAGGKFKRVGDRAYQRRVYRYILDHCFEGAWVWDFREGGGVV